MQELRAVIQPVIIMDDVSLTLGRDCPSPKIEGGGEINYTEKNFLDPLKKP